MLEASRDAGSPGRLGGLDSWYDGATITQLAGIPAIGYAPPGFASSTQNSPAMTAAQPYSENGPSATPARTPASRRSV